MQVDFDKSKHLSESMIKKRKEERERLIKEEADKEENEKKRSKLETLQKKEQMWVSKKCCDCDEQCVSWIMDLNPLDPYYFDGSGYEL